MVKPVQLKCDVPPAVNAAAAVARAAQRRPPDSTSNPLLETSAAP